MGTTQNRVFLQPRYPPRKKSTMSLNKKLIEFRTKIRKNQRDVVNSVINDHSANICIFCGEVDGLTKEHVIPKWVYDRCTKKRIFNHN